MKAYVLQVYNDYSSDYINCWVGKPNTLQVKLAIKSQLDYNITDEEVEDLLSKEEIDLEECMFTLECIDCKFGADEEEWEQQFSSSKTMRP